MNADWREEILDEVMGFIMDTAHEGRVPDLESIQEKFPQVKEDPLLRAEVESMLEMHQWFAESAGHWEEDFLAAQARSEQTGPKGARPLGSRWGDFLLVEELGRGGMGEVFKAWQISKRRFLALKRLDSRLLEDEQARERFRREPQLMRGIKHHGIIRVLEVGDHAGQPYFCMELVDGVSLGVLARSQALPTEQIARIMRDVSQSVAVAHRAGVLHRDLKPQNILLTKELEPKVGDFGLAKDLGQDSELTGSLDVLGTCNYMPPEQAAGKSDKISPRTDVYGLGAVLYELLTARPPFRGENVGDVLRQVQDVEPVAPRTINRLADEKLEAICLKCLEKNPEARYASAAELADEFDRVLHGRQPLAPLNSVARRLWRFCRRRPAVASLYIVCIVSAIVLSVTGVIAQRQSIRAGQESLRADKASLGAERATMRAEQEESRRQLAELDKMAADARRHVQAGQWQEALDALDGAVALGHPGSIPLRLERARCLMALDRMPEATKELSALSQEPQLPKEYRPAVDLWMGDALLGVDNDKAIGLIQNALTQGLASRADQEYASGLLAQDSPSAVGHLQAALRIEPYHQRAGQMLPFLLFVLGRVDEAAESLQVATAFFPHDAELWLLKSLVLIMQDKFDEAGKALSECEAQLGPERFEVVRQAAELLRDVRDPAKMSEISVPWAVLRCAPLLAKLSIDGQAQKGNTDAPLRVVMPPVLGKSYAEIARSIFVTGLMRPDANSRIEAFQRATRIHPEGTLYFLLGQAYVEEGRWQESVEALRKAAELPALSPARPKALYWLVRCQWQMSSEADGDQKARYRAGAIEDLYRLTQAWPPLAPGDLENLANMAREEHDAYLARNVVKEWSRQHPTDPTCDLVSGVVEMEVGNFAEAVDDFGRAREKMRDPAGADALIAASSRKLVKQAVSPRFALVAARSWLSEWAPKVLAAVEKRQASGSESAASK